MTQPDDFKKLFGDAKIDLATLEKMAKHLMKIPELRQIFNSQASEEGFEEKIDEFADEIEDLFNHKDSK